MIPNTNLLLVFPSSSHHAFSHHHLRAGPLRLPALHPYFQLHTGPPSPGGGLQIRKEVRPTPFPALEPVQLCQGEICPSAPQAKKQSHSGGPLPGPPGP